MTRAAILAVTALLAVCGAASAQTFRVVVVPGLELSDLRALESRGAVGLLVPANGPVTGRAQALAALERGAVENSYLGGMPPGVVRIEVEEATQVPASGNVIVLGLPERERLDKRPALPDRHSRLRVSRAPSLGLDPDPRDSSRSRTSRRQRSDKTAH